MLHGSMWAGQHYGVVTQKNMKTVGAALFISVSKPDNPVARLLF